tara:strand:- start:13464 stop:14294 length:831 start_codon:yes stop_codon:yes gene_type:complete
MTPNRASNLNQFLDDTESQLGEQFVRDGYVIIPVDDINILTRLQAEIAKMAATLLNQSTPVDASQYLNGIAGNVSVDALNDFRLSMIGAINRLDWLRPSYFALAKKALYVLAGNELVMQRRINLSIQMPKDESSLLPVHADVWSGDSPFEVVVWLPLVDCYETKSMYILSPKRNAEIHASIKTFANKSAEDLFQSIEPDVTFLNVPFGKALIFSQNLLHGNRINREADTRWSMNCRFKSVFSPYVDKKLGEFFDPITLRAVTRMGLNYQLPTGLHD